MKDYLDSCDAELSQSHFYRMLALGCFDSFITLPLSITTMVTNIVEIGADFNFYQGWTFIHSGWEPELFRKSRWSMSKWNKLTVYWVEWSNAFLALAFFALFGLTLEARRRYHRLFYLLCRPFQAKKEAVAEKELPEAVFKSGRRTDVTITSNVSSRYADSFTLAFKRISIKPYSNNQAEVEAWIIVIIMDLSTYRDVIAR